MTTERPPAWNTDPPVVLALSDLTHAIMAHAREMARDGEPMVRAAMLAALSAALQLSAHTPAWWAAFEREIRAVHGEGGQPLDIRAESVWACDFAAHHPLDGVWPDV